MRDRQVAEDFVRLTYEMCEALYPDLDEARAEFKRVMALPWAEFEDWHAGLEARFKYEAALAERIQGIRPGETLTLTVQQLGPLVKQFCPNAPVDDLEPWRPVDICRSRDGSSVTVGIRSAESRP